ncbi:mitochondrial inner membrane protein required for protein import [Thoreauomyces humboldtii]|nr:mitochondrial inner membrane protein required for protein import [Thoreauomyces humboldtii]
MVSSVVRTALLSAARSSPLAAAPSPFRSLGSYVRPLSTSALGSRSLRHRSHFPTQPPARWNPHATIRIRSPGSSETESSPEPPKRPAKREQPVEEEDPSDNQGLDLFAQAAANQKRREAEGRASGAADPESLDAADGAAGAGGPGPEARSEQEAERDRKYKAEAEAEESKQMAKTGRMILTSTILIGLGSFIYLGIPDETQQPKEGESYFANYHLRAWENLTKIKTTFTDPVLEKLLPDPLPAPYQRQLTLCIELTDALVHLEWDKSVGWRVATRPGVKQFLANLTRYYEVVVFTSSPGYLAQPVCQALDPHFLYTMYRLFRDHTKLIDGVYVKDLSQLNRDLTKTVLLDTKAESFQLQPENGLLLKPWLGERDDRELKKLETFFTELYVFMTVYGIEDVRPVLSIINAIDPADPATAWSVYKERARADFDARNNAPSASSSATSSRPSWLASLIGSGKSAQPVVPNVIDQIESIARDERAVAEQEAESMQQQMIEMQKQQEEAIKQQMEENKNKGLKLWDYLSGAGAPGAPGAPGQEPQLAQK